LQHNGVDVTRGPILVCAPPEPEPIDIVVSRRIGITQSADLPLRFFIRGNRFVSKNKSDYS
jgi:DNA-3-methyladenine glycosylase